MCSTYTVLKIETTRKEKNLSNFMAVSGLFPNGDQASKPCRNKRLLHTYGNSPAYISLHVRSSAESTCKALHCTEFSLLCLCIHYNVYPSSMYIKTPRSCTLQGLTNQETKSLLFFPFHILYEVPAARSHPLSQIDPSDKPMKLSVAGSPFTIVGPIGMVFPAASDIIPGSSTHANASDPNSDPSDNPDRITRGAILFRPRMRTLPLLESVLYKSATLCLQKDPVLYVDARPKVNASQHLYVLDLVSGQEITSKYSVLSVGGTDRDGNPIEYRKLEVSTASVE